MSDVKKNKQPKKLTPHQKDLPRLRVIHQYEKDFKTNYKNALKTGLTLLLKRAKKMIEDV